MSRKDLLIMGLIIFFIGTLTIFHQYSSALEDKDTLFQVSNWENFSTGSYEGNYTITELKREGDTGIGFLNGLEGELIMVNSTAYQITSNGTVKNASDYQRSPFAMITFFEADKLITLNKSLNRSLVENETMKSLSNPNIFYAIKVEGKFKYIKVRIINPPDKPYPNLTEVLNNSTELEYKEINGTLVGFWCPAYANGLNIPGFQFQFLSDNKTQGGYVLDYEIDSGLIMIDSTSNFFMVL